MNGTTPDTVSYLYLGLGVVAIIAVGFFAELAGLVWLGSRMGILAVLGLTALGFLVGGLLIRRSGTTIFQAMKFRKNYSFLY